MKHVEADMLNHLQAWLASNDGRFSDWDESPLPGSNHAGWRRRHWHTGEGEWLVNSRVFRREVCGLYRPLAMLRMLRAFGHLHTEGKGLTCRVAPPPYTSRVQVVWISMGLMLDGGNTAPAANA